MRLLLQHALLLGLTLWACRPAAAQGNVKVAGMNHYLVLKDDGTVWGFGECMDGELGPAIENCKYVPTPIQIELPGKAIDIATSNQSSLRSSKTAPSFPGVPIVTASSAAVPHSCSAKTAPRSAFLP